ncbi:MAG: hypothetical protein AB7P04_01875 [Bacteriovoracia bacterium]
MNSLKIAHRIRTVALIGVTAFWTACGIKITGPGFGARNASAVPGTPLVVSSLNNINAGTATVSLLTTSNNSMVVSGSGSAASGSGGTASPAAAAVSSTMAASGSTTSTLLGTDTREVEVSVNATLESDATNDCSLLGDLPASWICGLPSFFVSTLDISRSVDMVVRFTSRLNGSQNVVDLVSIPVRKFVVEATGSTTGNTNDEPSPRITVDGIHYFSASNAMGNSKLYRLDGLSPVNVIDALGAGSSDIYNTLTEFSGGIYLGASVSAGVTKLRKISGSGVEQVSNIVGGGTDFPIILGQFAGNLYFSANNGGAGQPRLYRTDGSGIHLVSATTGAASDAISTQGFAVLGNYGYFVASDATTTNRLFRTDGTSVELVFNSGSAGNDGVDAAKMTAIGSYVYFVGRNASGKTKLFRTNGTSVSQISDIAGAATADSPSKPVEYGNGVYFTAANAAGAVKLYRYDGDHVSQIVDLVQNSALSDNITSLTAANGYLFFIGYEATGTYLKLYSYDGTTVRQVSNTSSTNDLVTGAPLQAFAGFLFFAAADSVGLVRLHLTDGKQSLRLGIGQSVGHDVVAAAPRFYADSRYLYFQGYASDGNRRLLRVSY